MIKLSIIIPCYNAGNYIHELLDVLYPQLTDECELIIVDDGSDEPFKTDYKCTVIRQENKGASAARNTGLDTAKGEYIAFIDADDLVSDKYIETILNKAKTEEFDYLYMSWRAFGGWNMNVFLKSVDDKFPPFNLCVWNRVYKRSMIGDVRFNTKKACAEDAQFIRDVKEEGKKAFIGEYMYFYRADAKDSLTKRARAGKVDTTRIVYYYPEVTEDMKYLIDEFAELDKDVEVILMTKKNALPELVNHAMVITPQLITGTELRGEYTPLFQKVDKPLKTQVLIYVSALYAIGGIETWTYNFCKSMHKYYDLMILYDKKIDETQRRRLLPFAEVVKNTNKPITCDTALNCRTALVLPKNVIYKHKYMVVHTCKMRSEWEIKDKADNIFVSRAARDSWGLDGDVIYNLTQPSKPRKALLLVSASRLSWEKGENRIITLAQMLHNLGILFTWLVFTDSEPKTIVDGLVYRRPTMEIKSYIQKADFYVQLSDQESFCYSLVEALELGVPVITTPLAVLPEIGFKEGVNGFAIPFNVQECKNLLEIVNSDLKFEYSRDNDKIVEEWRGVLGDTTPTKSRSLKAGCVYCAANIEFKDARTGKRYQAGEVFQMDEKRAKKAQKQGFIDILE
jgi:glycosyltransferase involved in cell wall biosynthesis